MLLPLASVVFLGSESLGTRDHILLSQILDFPFRRLLRLAGHGPKRKHIVSNNSCCCFRIRCHGNVFIEPLPSNGRLRWLHYLGLQASCYTAPSLRLYVPNNLQVCHHFFFSEECAMDVCHRSHIPPSGSVFMAFTFQLLPLLSP
jgi:hypothetical protein